MDRRKLIMYLLLNIFLSACVTLAIIYWYDRNYRAVTLPQPVMVSSTAGAQPNSTGAGPVEGALQIVSVIGAGNLEVEAVVIKYTGEGELDLTGWHLREATGHNYTFPAFKLFRDGAVQVHTASGTNTAIDLFWGQQQPAWESGQLVLLTTPEGEVQDSYPVP
jgi:hypothetical protein